MTEKLNQERYLKLITSLFSKTGNKKTVGTLIKHFVIFFIGSYNTCYCHEEPLFIYNYLPWFNYFINFVAIFLLTRKISWCYDRMFITYGNYFTKYQENCEIAIVENAGFNIYQKIAASRESSSDQNVFAEFQELKRA